MSWRRETLGRLRRACSLRRVGSVPTGGLLNAEAATATILGPCNCFLQENRADGCDSRQQVPLEKPPPGSASEGSVRQRATGTWYWFRPSKSRFRQLGVHPVRLTQNGCSGSTPPHIGHSAPVTVQLRQKAAGRHITVVHHIRPVEKQCFQQDSTTAHFKNKCVLVALRARHLL